MVDITVDAPHQVGEHVACAVTAGATVRVRPSLVLTAQTEDDPFEVSSRPVQEPTQSLREAPRIDRMVRFPSQPEDFREQILQVLGPVADLEPAVQEAQQDDHFREQCLPGRLRAFPAVGADGTKGSLSARLT